MRMRLLLLLTFFLLLMGGRVQAEETMSFEGKTIPAFVRSTGQGKIHLSSVCYKDGRQSLCWQYHPGDTLELTLPSSVMTRRVWRDGGMRMWVYTRTEHAATPVLRVDFLDQQGSVLGGFDYYMQKLGWRACWMSFRRMRGEQPGSPPLPPKGALPVTCRITAPQHSGQLWLDRLVLPESKADYRTTPDAQTPHNALVVPSQLGHWAALWPWEQLSYDLPLRKPDARACREMALLEERLDHALKLPPATAADRRKAEQLWKAFAIAYSPPCGGYTGAPLVCADECRADAGEVNLEQLAELMNLLTRCALAGDARSAERYLLLWEYALNQGFAHGSGMGTNHHYGYATRHVFRSAWLMRHEIAGHSAHQQICDSLTYWAGLQETRRPVAEDLADRCDSWNTLLIPRLLVALMEPDLVERERKLRSLARWLDSSLVPTPGTLGGIKADGTVFHHSGFYPAYADGGLSSVGLYVELCAHTRYGLSAEGRAYFGRALDTMLKCSNVRDWPIGISGRHPFRFGMTHGCVEAFARLAHVERGDVARKLMQDYKWLRSEGSRAPLVFFAFNHAAAGVYRHGAAMVLMKGFNQDVWGSEIYTKENRYGRYQSYGSVSILGGGTPVSLADSGFAESGWDWNRVPGSTTIHLPLQKLESPRTSTLMAYNRQAFAGAGALEGRAGMFALHLQEADYPNFTPDFKARKSVFCCAGGMLCLGSGICNSNALYETETTLFQCSQQSFAGRVQTPKGWVQDGVGNFFRVLQGHLKLHSGTQHSRENKTKSQTQGSFRVAWLDHGKAPSEECYAYLVLLQPTQEQILRADKKLPFEILEQSPALHAALHRPTGTYAYAAFEASSPATGIFGKLPAEVIVLYRSTGSHSVVMSVTDPKLHLPRHGRDIPDAGRAVEHELVLRGDWRLERPTAGVSLRAQGETTTLRVTCHLGLPVQFRLIEVVPQRP